ncbi:MAG TPA: alpha/beta hydrolase family protein [Pyrinomonadaceae bacterium]|nr:alpha/beta hydrolase family protein [Pyrinomonadaceae bacterium]
MKNTRTLLLLLLALAAPNAHAQTARQQTPAQNAKAAKADGKKPEEKPRHEAVQFESRLVGAVLPYNVVLPADYRRSPSKERRYPVLYLLHGLGGSAADWVSGRAHLADYAAQYPFIVVVPEGKDGWYTDGAAPGAKFESYFFEELIPDVDRRFRTIASREGRAVAGLSMGGYGSMKFALKRPELFAFAASMSGALAVASWTPDVPLPEFVKPSVMRVYGEAGSRARLENDVYKLVRELTPERAKSLPFLYLDCGTEDFLIGNSRDFSALLIEKKVAHEFRELPGTHSWPYWDRQVQEVLRLAARQLSAPADGAKAAGQ